MLPNISEKVKNMPRQLDGTESVVDDDESPDPILIVSGYGTDDKLTKTLKKHEENLLKTNSFKKAKKPLFRFVKKTGANRK